MRLTILVRADYTGLGIQTRDYYKFLNPNKTVIIDISSLNGNKQNYDWYPNSNMIIKGIPTDAQCLEILKDTDVLLTAETPYNPNLFKFAKQQGIKTVCVENPEFFDQFKYPDMPLSDVIILPSVWKEQEIRDYAEPRGTKVYQIHHPVDRDVYKFKLRTDGRAFHSSGKPAAYDRNGTFDFLQACRDSVMVTQDEGFANRARRQYKCNVFTEAQHHNNPDFIYSLGDILVLPRRYGGNCLPLNEALSSGMPVIMTDVSPNNHLLPAEWLVPAHKIDSFTPRGQVDIYATNIDALRERYNWVRDNIQSQSLKANEIAETISWKTLLPKYDDVLRSVL